MIKKILVTIILLSIIPTLSFAQARVVSESILVLQAEDINSFISNNNGQWSGDIDRSMDDIQFAEPYNTVVSGIDLKTGFDLSLDENIVEPGQYPFLAKLNNINISAQQVSTQDTIERRVGSIFLRIRIEGICSELMASLPGDVSVGGQVNFDIVDGKAQFELTDLNLFHNSQWELSVTSCSGMNEYEEQLLDEVRNQLANIESLTEVVREAMQSELNNRANELNEKIFNPVEVSVSEDIKGLFLPQSIELQENGEAYIHSLFYLDFPNIMSTRLDTFVELKEKPKTGSGQSRLVLPVELISKFSRAMYRNNIYNESIKAQENGSLKKLFSSRFSQFFSWPDLMKFSKKADFRFNVYSQTNPEILAINEDDGVLSLDISSLVTTNMYAPKDNGHVGYVSFFSETTASLNLEVVGTAIQASFSGVDLDTEYVWDPTYLENYRVNKRISTSMIDRRLEKVLEERQLKFDFAPIDLGPSGQLYLNSFQLEGQNIELILGDKIQEEVRSSQSSPSGRDACANIHWILRQHFQYNHCSK